MKLNLTRPLVFIDIEATGLDPQTDRIVELSLCKVHPDGTREVKTNRYNPGFPIPEKSTEIHGIKDEDVKDCPLFKQHAVGITNFLQGCDMAGFNSNRYDLPMLNAEMSRAGMIFEYEKMRLIDVGNIFKIQEPRTLAAAVKFYCGRDMEGAHGAEADILETVNVFEAQLERYQDLPTNLDELALYSNHGQKMLDLSGKFGMNEQGVIILNFGKHRGEPAAHHPDFLEWMVYKASFPADTVKVAMKILHGEDDIEMLDEDEVERIDPSQLDMGL